MTNPYATDGDDTTNPSGTEDPSATGDPNATGDPSATDDTGATDTAAGDTGGGDVHTTTGADGNPVYSSDTDGDGVDDVAWHDANNDGVYNEGDSAVVDTDSDGDVDWADTDGDMQADYMDTNNDGQLEEV